MRKIIILLILILLTGCSSEKTYTVTINNEDGTILDSYQVKAGETIENKEVPEKEGYIFVSYLKDGHAYEMTTPVNENITLTIDYVLKPDIKDVHTVSFNYGNEVKKTTVKDNEKISKPATDPLKENYEFVGWYDGNELYDFDRPVTKDLVLIAQFKKNKITVTFDLQGGSGTVKKEYDTDKLPTKPNNPTKFGYKFIGWLLNGELYNFDKTLTEDTTLVASWETKKYFTVNFDSDGGTEISEEYIEENTSVSTPNEPKKEGYTFLYWTLDNKEYDFTSKITSDITLVAKYEKIAN